MTREELIADLLENTDVTYGILEPMSDEELEKANSITDYDEFCDYISEMNKKYV